MTQGEAEGEKDADKGPGKMPVAAAGARWGCFTIDRTSRFIVAWAAGVRDAEMAKTVVRTTRARTAGRHRLDQRWEGRV